MLTDVYASLAILPIEVDEAAAFSVAVTLTDPNWTPGAQPPVVHPATTVTLQFAGSATQGEDYTVSSATISIPAWSGRSVGGSITLTVLRDNRVEGDETIDVSVAAGAGYTLQQPAGTISTTTRTTVIKDDPPRVSIWIAEGQTGAVREATIGKPRGSASLGTESSPPVTRTVYLLRSGGDTNTTIPITLIASGTASTTDYELSSGLAINVGTYAEFTVSARDDSITEDHESLLLTVASAPADYLINQGEANVLISIEDDLIDYATRWTLKSSPTGFAPRLIYAVPLDPAGAPRVTVRTLWKRLEWRSTTLRARNDNWGEPAIVNGTIQLGEQVTRSTTNAGTWSFNIPIIAALIGAPGVSYSITVSIDQSIQTTNQVLVQAGPEQDKVLDIAVYTEDASLVATDTVYVLSQQGGRNVYSIESTSVKQEYDVGYTGVANKTWKAEATRRLVDEDAPAPDGFERGSALDLDHLSPITPQTPIRKSIPPAKLPLTHGTSSNGGGSMGNLFDSVDVEWGDDDETHLWPRGTDGPAPQVSIIVDVVACKRCRRLGLTQHCLGSVHLFRVWAQTEPTIHMVRNSVRRISWRPG